MLSPIAPSPSTNRSPAIVVSAIPPEIARRTWSINCAAAPTLCHLFFVEHGKALFETDEQLDLAAPCLLWLPQRTTGTFHVEAGGDGFAAAIAWDLIRRTIGDTPLTTYLRPLLGDTVLLRSGQVAPLAQEIGSSLAVLTRETRQQNLGSAAMTAAHLTLLLLQLWRGSGQGVAAGLRGTRTTTAQRFQHLVEIHYREPLGIADYAALLGVTRSHLHDACKRAFGRPPMALVHERLIREAQDRLHQTELPIEQIAFSLGFQDSGYFNRFFKRWTTVTPGSYRASRSNPRLERTQKATFADWP